MSRFELLSSAIAFSLAAGIAAAAEDHSAHQQHMQPQPQPQAQEHEDHAQHAAPASDQPTESELRHIPPPPPQRPMHDMTNAEMIELMQMDDAGSFGMLLLDEFEWRESEDDGVLAWDAQAWYGDDYNKAWLKAEGERVDGEYEGRFELLWDRIFSRWWSLQAGIRHDIGDGPSRSWLAFGVQGLAPHWFEVEAAVYGGEQGRTAARFAGEYEVLITQRLVLQPEIELNLYGKDDPDNGIGAGLADTQVGLRLRYELRREFAPYIGVAWTRHYGDTADLTRAAGHDRDQLQFLAGLRVWF